MPATRLVIILAIVLVAAALTVFAGAQLSGGAGATGYVALPMLLAAALIWRLWARQGK
ncbi:MAG: hypothetical protein WCD16_15210 [Paracoccaceae bacterium]